MSREIVSSCCPTSVAFIVIATLMPVAVGAEQSVPAQDGQVLYQQLCASCHGLEGHGDGVVADDVVLRPRDFAMNAFKFDTDADWEVGTDIDLTNVIKYGAATYGGSALMPPWASLTEQDIATLVDYIRQLQR